MKKFEDLILRGYYQLTAEGHWLDASRLIWVNKGKKIDDNRELIIYFFESETKPNDVEKNIKEISKNQYMTSLLNLTMDGMNYHLILNSTRNYLDIIKDCLLIS